MPGSFHERGPPLNGIHEYARPIDMSGRQASIHSFNAEPILGAAAGVQIMDHNLAPALEWAEQHRAELVASSGEQAVSTFQFRLHRLQFLHLLQTEGACASPRPCWLRYKGS